MKKRMPDGGQAGAAPSFGLNDYRGQLALASEHIARREAGPALSALITARTLAPAGAVEDSLFADAFVQIGVVAAEDGGLDQVRMVIQQLCSLRQYESAEALARFLLDLAPDSAIDLKHLLAILSQSGREAEAAALLEARVAECAARPAAGYQLLRLVTDWGRFDLAQAIMAYAAEGVATDMTPFLYLCEANKARPDKAAAEAFFQALLAAHAGHPVVTACIKRHIPQSIDRSQPAATPAVSMHNPVPQQPRDTALLLPTDVQRVYLHHMAGTGGNTFATALAGSMQDCKVVQVTDKVEEGVWTPADVGVLQAATGTTLFYGHNLFGLPETIGIQTNYATLLRNPYDRLISDFFWLACLEPDITAHEALRRFFHFVEEAPHLEFYIHFCGPLGFDNPQHFSVEACSRISNPDADAVARTNLDHKFWLVGITELFEESLYLAAMHTGCSSVFRWWEKRHPQTRFRPAFMDLPKRIRSMIEDKTAFDMALYEDYRAAFEARFAAEGDNAGFVSYFNNAHPCR